MALLSPRLGVLNNIPFAIPFDVRVSIFRNFVINDSRKHGDDLHSLRYSRTTVTIRRDHIAEDGFDKLGDANLKGHVQITFIDKFGEPEYIDLSRLSRSPANVTPNVGLVLTVEGCSRNSLRRFAKRSSIQTGGCG